MGGKVGIVNYGVAGNIFSIQKAVQAAGGDVKIIEKVEDFQIADKLILPGVGSFQDAMNELEEDGFKEVLIENSLHKPTLGICLGMQILSTLGFEYGETDGLGLIDAEVKPIECRGTVPHMGLNTINKVKDSMLLEGIEDEHFYFMHSYEVVNYTDVLAVSTYHNHQFISAIQKDNLFGVQFHPEKSREAGIQLFQNFLKV